MKNPQSFMLDVVRNAAIRAVATRTPADAAALAVSVQRAFGVPYAIAAQVCCAKYGVAVVDSSLAGRGATCTKDGRPVGYDRKVSSSEVSPRRNAVPATLLAGIA